MITYDYLLNDELGNVGKKLSFYAGEKKTINFWLREKSGRPKTFPAGVTEVVLKILKPDTTFLTKKLSLAELAMLAYGGADFYFVLSSAETIDLKSDSAEPNTVSASLMYVSGTTAREKFDLPSIFQISETVHDLET